MHGSEASPGHGAAARAQRRAWLAVCAWIGLIFVTSLDAFSAEATGSRLAALFRFLGFGTEAVAPVHFFVRKGAHVALYAGLGLLATRAAGMQLPAPRALRVSLAIALAVAGADEAHQATTASRTGSPWDVLLDLAGAALGALAWRWR